MNIIERAARAYVAATSNVPWEDLSDAQRVSTLAGTRAVIERIRELSDDEKFRTDVAGLNAPLGEVCRAVIDALLHGLTEGVE